MLSVLYTRALIQSSAISTIRVNARQQQSALVVLTLPLGQLQKDSVPSGCSQGSIEENNKSNLKCHLNAFEQFTMPANASTGSYWHPSTVTLPALTGISVDGTANI